MAVRQFRTDPFSGSQEVVCAVGGSTTLPGGAWSVAALVYCQGDGSPIISFRTGTTRVSVELLSTTQMLVTVGGFGETLVIPDVIDQWIVIGASRAAGGATATRGHVYYYDTDTHFHADLTDTLFDEGSTIDNIRLGRNPDSGSTFRGQIGLISAWTSNLSDGQYETLPPGLQPWLSLTPIGCWPLNQDDVGDGVDDITNNGADETSLVGTTVVVDNDPPFNFDLTPPQVSAAIALTLSVNPVSNVDQQVSTSIALTLGGNAQSEVDHQAITSVPLSLVISPSVEIDHLISATIPLTIAVSPELPSTLLPGRPLMPEAPARDLHFGASDIAEARPIMPYYE